MDAKAAAKRVLRGAGQTAAGQRLLRFYETEGLIEAPPAPPTPPVQRNHTDDPEVAVLRDLWDRNLATLPRPTFDLLTEHLDDNDVPPLDRRNTNDTTNDLTADQRHWRDHGYLLKQDLIPAELVDAYWQRRQQLDRPHGWSCTAPYMHVPEAMALATYKPLNDIIDTLIGEPMAVSLNLTGIVSTERNWHQDDYLNPPAVNGWYAAAWFALGDVHPDAGPFQFVPGSHRWPALRRDRVRLYLTPEERSVPQWPRYTERFLDDVLDEEIARRGATVETFLGSKGDVLLWHSRLVHRGSPPNVPGMTRPSFIAHYTGVNHWSGGSVAIAPPPGGGRYFVQDVPLDE